MRSAPLWNTLAGWLLASIVAFGTQNTVTQKSELQNTPEMRSAPLWNTLRECEVYFLFGELAKRKRARLQSPLTHSGWRRCYHNIVFPSNKTTRFHHHHRFCICLISFDRALTKPCPDLIFVIFSPHKFGTKTAKTLIKLHKLFKFFTDI